MPRRHVSALLLLLACACGAPTRFVWGDYDEWLYENYQDPKSEEELYVALNELITEYESRKNPETKPMAPGLYAEYGFLLMQRGETQLAIDAYEKEKALWPESAKFMDSMIETARISGRKTGTEAVP